MLPEEVNAKMPENTRKKFKVIGDPLNGFVPGLSFSKGEFGMVEFEKLTPERAEMLVKEKFPYLEKIDAKRDEAAPNLKP